MSVLFGLVGDVLVLSHLLPIPVLVTCGVAPSAAGCPGPSPLHLTPPALFLGGRVNTAVIWEVSPADAVVFSTAHMLLAARPGALWP